MKREIKFRGLRTDGKGWAYGNLLNEQTIGEVGENLSHYKYVTVIPETVGQFTGLYDKNGVEIYEGDKLPTNDSEEVMVVVRWDNEFSKTVVDSYGYNIHLGEGGQEVYDNEISVVDTEDLGDILTEYLDVIGNIHDKTETK